MARWRMIERTCSDEAARQDWLGGPQRGNVGWHELAWPEVKRVNVHYAPWAKKRLILDEMNPAESNIRSPFRYS